MQSPPSESQKPNWSLQKTAFKFGVSLLCLGGLVTFLLPSGHPRWISDRTMCRHILNQLGMAMHHYHDAYHCFPPAFVADKTGRPMHSWRVLLLPFLEQKDLYAQYRFDEPWNGPHNRLLADRTPEWYRCPADRGSKPETGSKNDTNYLVVVGPNTIFPGAVPRRIDDVTDGTQCTLLIVEAADSHVNWMEPRDMPYADALLGLNARPGLTISSHHPQGANVLFADGHVQFLPLDTPPQRLKLLLERNDGQTVSGLQD